MQQDKDGETALHVACNRDSPSIDMLRFLVDNGGGQVVILKQDKDGWTALHVACYRDSPSIDMLQFLMGNGGG